MPLLNEWTRVDEAGMRALREVKIGIIDEKVIFTKVTIHVRNLEKASRYSMKYPVYESIENWIEEITELSFVVLVVTPLAVSLLNGLMLEVLDIEAISTLDDAC